MLFVLPCACSQISVAEKKGQIVKGYNIRHFPVFQFFCLCISHLQQPSPNKNNATVKIENAVHNYVNSIILDFVHQPTILKQCSSKYGLISIFR
jgi:hypothetical protein